MSSSVDILIFEKGAVERAPQLVSTVALKGKTELGRQESTTEALYSCNWRDEEQVWRLVIARGTEQTIGRHHATVQVLPDGRIELNNTSTRSTVQVENGPSLPQSQPTAFDLPPTGLVLRLGSSRVIRLQPKSEPAVEIHQLHQPTMSPDEMSGLSMTMSGRLQLPTDSSINPEAVVSWLQMALSLLQSAANSDDFYDRAAQAIVDLVSMDSGRAMVLERQGWVEKAKAFSGGRLNGDPFWQPSQRILDRVRTEKRTFWELPRLNSMGSMVGVQAVVAAPILDQRGDVIGVLYGDRRSVAKPITRIEAMLVELVACGVASRLARAKEEQAMLRFGQFFSPTLARHLVQQTDLLEGRLADVTILFVDVRGYSRIAHRLPSASIVGWISDVLSALSDCVIDHQGVLVDYIGDELMAMWGAPEEHPDHAVRAVNAALDMLEKLPAINSRWQAALGEPIGIGVGINSGEAHVGNIGSHRKFKYGPLGNTVNTASRVQGVTRHLKARMLITRDTYDRLDGPAKTRTRRIGPIKMHNIENPVELYEMAARDQAFWPEWKDNYETALAEFERENFREATRHLQSLIVEAINDGPSIILMSRAINGLANGASANHPVMEFLAK